MMNARSALLATMTGVLMCSDLRGGAGGGSQPRPPLRSQTISILIAPGGWAQTEPHVYPLRKPIAIRCLIRNQSRKPVAFSLKDHDAYHGTLPYAVGIAVRVEQDDGRVLTANDIDRSGEGWWSQYYLWSTSFEPTMPGDTILLPPGGEVVRVIPIDQVLLMAPEAKDGLTEGTYTVRIRLNGIISNPIKIVVVPLAP